MSIITFDTLAFSRKLENAGLPKEHAEAITEAQKQAASEIVATNQLATRSDLLAVRTELKEEIQAVRTELKEEIQAVRTELKEEIQAVRTELKEDIQAAHNEVQSMRAEIKAINWELKNKNYESPIPVLYWLIPWILGVAAIIMGVLAWSK